MKPIGVHHVSINVVDVDAAVAFYTDVLGFTRRNDRPDFPFPGAWLDVGDQQLHLIGGDVPAAKGQHFAIRVESIEAAVAALRARGATVSDPSPVGTGKQAFVSDPSGNLVEIHETAS